MDTTINEETFKEILNIVLKAGYNQAISDALEIAQKYEYSDAHNMEIDEIEALRK